MRDSRNAMQCDATSLESGGRLATFLRAVYPDARAKRVARDWCVDERTAEGWLAGRLPGSAMLAAMCRRWGASFADFVLVSSHEWDAAEHRLIELEARAVAAQAELYALRQERRAAARQGAP